MYTMTAAPASISHGPAPRLFMNNTKPSARVNSPAEVIIGQGLGLGREELPDDADMDDPLFSSDCDKNFNRLRHGRGRCGVHGWQPREHYRHIFLPTAG